MFKNIRPSVLLLAVSALIFGLAFSVVYAQDSAIEEIKYKEDYDRVQALLKVTDLTKRTDAMVSMYKDRRDMNEQIRVYLDNLFVRDLDALLKKQNFASLKGLTDRALKVRPRFGEAYLYQGIVLKNEKKMQEAMIAFARGFIIQNPLQNKCKQQLDLLYRAANSGSLIGQEKFVKEAMKGLK